MAINPINPYTIMHSNDPEILVCKCGNEPYPGSEFYYKSKYSKEPTIGIIARVDKTHIFTQLMVLHIIKMRLKLNQNILQEKKNLMN